MTYLTGNSAKFLMIMIVLAGCFYSLTAQIAAQKTEEIMVPILQSFSSRNFRCLVEDNFYDEAGFKWLINNKDCSFPKSEAFQPDFKTQTLVGFRVHGDCHVRASAAVFRNDKVKKYEIRVRNIWGGCRAGGGTFQGWFTIEKIKSDYKVEFSEIKADDYGYSMSGKDYSMDLLLTPKSTTLPESLETRSYQMNDCIHLFEKKRIIIRDDDTFKKSIRSDGSREKCLNKLENIDFDKHTLLGIEINSGHCEIPPGLKYQAIKDSAKKEYILDISYMGPGSCRALSQYDLWVLVPKLSEDYRINFETKAIRQIR